MKNTQAEYLLNNLNTMMNTKGIIAYKVAYNFRKLRDELQEYFKAKEELLRKYGEEENGELRLSMGSENYPLFMREFEPIATQEINVELKKFTESELNDCQDLTGNQILFLLENLGEEKND